MTGRARPPVGDLLAKGRSCEPTTQTPNSPRMREEKSEIDFIICGKDRPYREVLQKDRDGDLEINSSKPNQTKPNHISSSISTTKNNNSQYSAI